MALIEGFRVQNYRALRDVTLGKLSSQQQGDPLTPFTVVIGKNGVGKSTLFDAFGFVADCLSHDVEAACDMKQRGGFERLRSIGVDEPHGHGALRSGLSILYGRKWLSGIGVWFHRSSAARVAIARAAWSTWLSSASSPASLTMAWANGRINSRRRTCRASKECVSRMTPTPSSMMWSKS